MAIDLTYDHLVTHIVPGPRNLSYFVPLLLLPIALLIPPSKASQSQLCAVFLPVITAATLHAWKAMGGVDVVSVDVLCWSYYMLAFKDPRQDFRRLIFTQKTKEAVEYRHKSATNGHLSSGVNPVPKYTEQAYPSTLAARLPWVGTLMVSLRLRDWKIGLPSHDAMQPARPAHTSHIRFIVIAFLRAILGFLILDLTSAWTHYDAYFITPHQSIDSPLPQCTLLPDLLPPRLFRSSILALQAWATVSQQFHLPCIIPVILHRFGLMADTWAPHLWAPFFGSFTSIFTSPGLGALSGFWGRYWHQMLRHYCSGPGLWIANTARLSRPARYAILAISAFLLSGVVHMGLVPPEPLHATMSANGIRLLIAAFFWVQPLGLAFEAFVSQSLKRAHMPPALLIAINVIWFTAWSCAVLPLLGEAGRQLGYWYLWPVPLSLWRGLRQGEWIAWECLK